MNLNEVLLAESLSQIVYHKTTAEAFYNIVKNNEFRLQLVAGPNARSREYTSGSRFYYASFARSPMSGFMQKMHGSVVMELDGRALSANYRARPVDFFSGFSNTTDEMEDRLFSYEPIIKNFNRYIVSVHILRGSDYEAKLAADHLSLNYNTDIFYYDNRSDFVMLKNGIRYSANEKEEEFETLQSDDKEHMRFNREYYETLVHAIELLEANDFNELSEDAQEELRFMKGTATGFTADVKAALNRVRPNNKITVEFTKRMRQYGIRPDNVMKLAKIIEDKWLT